MFKDNITWVEANNLILAVAEVFNDNEKFYDIMDQVRLNENPKKVVEMVFNVLLGLPDEARPEMNVEDYKWF